MRKITYKAARAFIEGRNFSRGNTSVTIHHGFYCVRNNLDYPDGMRKAFYLHGNCIAEQTPNGLGITLADWPTTTTRDRLNGLLTELGKCEGVWQHKHEQYYGTHEANRIISSSEWITVT